MRPIHLGTLKTGLIARLAMVVLTAAVLAGRGPAPAEGAAEQSEQTANRTTAVREPSAVRTDKSHWQESAAIETPGWLPGSVAQSVDGKTIVVSGTDGHVIAYNAATRKEQWKTNYGGGFAAVAYTADQNSILATFKDGVRFLDADTGKILHTFENIDCHATAVAAFPDEVFPVNDQPLIKNHKIVYGSARGYVVKTWIDLTKDGTIELSNLRKGQEPADANAVPLAVDPAGRSVILTGPVHRDTGKNVLWAWVAGNYGEGSPGNRLMEGHEAAVVSAAWSRDGATALTGDADGRVIVWDAKTMQESRRFELGGRVAALALSPDGQDFAAVAVKQQAEFHVGKVGQPEADRQLIHVDRSDFAGPIYACLSFSPDGKVLVGSAINTAWLARLGRLVGKVHFWERGVPD